MINLTKHNLKNTNDNIILRSGQCVSFAKDDICKDASHTLFFSCEDAMCPTLKNESGSELLYMLIDDSLNFEQAKDNRFCLDYSSKKPLPFPKRIVKKVIWQPLVYGLYPYKWFTDEYCETWTGGIFVKAENLEIRDGGYLRMRFDKWNVREGVEPNDTICPPDETFIIDISEGTYDYTEFKKEMTIAKDTTACVIVTVEGEGYTGNVYFEKPYLCDFANLNLLPEFDRGSIGVERHAWLGQNLSKREWPLFEVKVNGKVCFDDEVFLKVHRFSPVEIKLPAELIKEGKNEITLTYKSDYLDAIPVVIDEVYLLEEHSGEFNLVRCPEEVVWGDSAALLVETELGEDELEFESDDFLLEEVTRFEKCKFTVLSIAPKKHKNNLTFTLKSEKTQEEFTVSRCVEKQNDNVLSGSGDMIYIDISKEETVRDYIKWYVGHNIGNLLTVRPVYRWGGQRTVCAKVWDMFRPLCEKLGISYVHISDGRDIPGLNTNPTFEMMKGKNFLGRQLHERDGQLFYWGREDGHPREIEAPLQEFFDLAARIGREYPDTVEGSYRPFNIEWSESGYSYRRNFPKTPDIAEARDVVAKSLQNLSSDSFIRHTGPSVMFKYYYQNGFEWTGAETMDGSTEILLSFLRGASQAYDKEKYGVHLALQWSTFPHDLPQRYRRYLLSLYVPYMHGVTDINTEEGLWYMEAFLAYHNRLSEACHMHRKELNRFNRFIKTHSRTGTFYTPIAFLHGNLDGWNGFNSPFSWGIPSMPAGCDCSSWKLLKTFYPNDAIADHGCSKVTPVFENNDKPYGLFSGTPNGSVDVVPAEHGDLSKYKLLVFAGYNCMTDDVYERVECYVKSGGTLICTWAHFSDTTLNDDVVSCNLNVIDSSITKMLSGSSLGFVSDTIDGKEIKVCPAFPADAKIHAKTDSGNPLAFTANYGEGKIILVNALCYPGCDPVFGIYDKLVKDETAKILAEEPVRITCGDDVEYSVFRQIDGTRHYYFTAVDWYNNSEANRRATISFEQNNYDVEFAFGDLVKLVTDGKCAVWPESDSAEVMGISADGFTAQGYGKQKFFVAKDGAVTEYEVDFENDPIKTILF